jgi:hypothetical protein
MKISENMQNLLKEYKEIIEHPDYTPVKHKTAKLLAVCLDNYKKRNALEEISQTGDISKYDPVLVSVLRQGLPHLIGPEIFGTQPMTNPSGLIFCIKPEFQNSSDYPVKKTNSKVLIVADGSGFTTADPIATNGAGAGKGIVRYIEGNKLLVQVSSGTFADGDSIDNADPYVSAVTTISTVYANQAQYRFLFKDYAKYDSVALAEAATTNMKEMGISIEKVTVTADSYKLKAKYTDELQQDLKAQHNLDAETELIQLLGDEIAIEQNQRFIYKLNEQAVLGGSTTWVHESTLYGGDADGRWAAEKVFAFYMYINKIANQVVKTTMRGRANFMVTSLDIASMFESFKFWYPTMSLANIPDVNLGQTAMVGVLGGKLKVYVDMYATTDYVSLGYKGASEWDAGIYYCPYIPVYVKKAIDPESGQPRIFFHTRYGMGENPFGAEKYYRYIDVTL